MYRYAVYWDDGNANTCKICADLAFQILHRNTSMCLCMSCMLYVLNGKWKQHTFPLIGRQWSQRFHGQWKNSLSPLINWNRDIKTGRAAKERQRETIKGTEHRDISFRRGNWGEQSTAWTKSGIEIIKKTQVHMFRFIPARSESCLLLPRLIC